MIIKAISLTEPWAFLMAISKKKIETRCWRTNYTGPIAIHAAKNFPLQCRDLCKTEPFRSVLLEAGIKHWNELPVGAVLGTGTLMSVIKFDDSTAASMPEPERSFGDFTAGRYGFLIPDVKRFSHPIPARGMLNLWNWEMPE